MTGDPVVFLTTRLDELEQIARAAGDRPWEAGGGYPQHIIAVGPAALIAETFWGNQDSVAWPAEHITRHDPPHVLADIAAKRRLIARHTGHGMGGCFTLPARGVCERPHHGVKVCNWDQHRWPCADLVDLIGLFGQHPDYDPEWAGL